MRSLKDCEISVTAIVKSLLESGCPDNDLEKRTLNALSVMFNTANKLYNSQEKTQ